MNKEVEFKCEKCGADGLYLERTYTQTVERVSSVPCLCDSEHEFAAERRILITTTFYEQSPIDDEHCLGEVEISEEIDNMPILLTQKSSDKIVASYREVLIWKLLSLREFFCLVYSSTYIGCYHLFYSTRLAWQRGF